VKTVSRTLQLFLAVLVIAVGLSVASVRVLFPNADRYRGDLEIWLGGIAGQPVAIGLVQAEWQGWRPEFRINDLRLRDPAQRGKDGGVSAHFESATVSVDVLASLLGGELRPGHIHIGDVSLRVSDAAATATPDAAVQQHLLAVLQWLLSQHHLGLDATRVELSDFQVAGEPVVFTNLQLEVRNTAASHVLDVALQVPGTQNGSIAASAKLTGDPTSSQWSGDISLVVEKLNLATVEVWRSRLGNTDVAGRVSMDLDSRWRDGVLVEANGRLSGSNMRVESVAGVLGPISNKAVVKVAGADGDWRVRVLRAGPGFLSIGDPSPLATLRYTGAPSQPRARVSTTIANLDIAALIPLLPIALQLPDHRWQQMLDAAPGGQLRDLAMTMERDAGGISDFSVAGDFQNVRLRTTGGLPALTGVKGSFDHDSFGTRVAFTDGGIVATLADMYPAPIAGKQLHGEVAWSEHGGERRLVLSDVGFVTPDVTARATGSLVWRGDDTMPFVDLSLGFSDGNLDRLEYFIPTSTFGKKTGQWLDKAFPRGRLSAGTVELLGYPPRKLDRELDFSVTVQATVQGTTVHYLDGWPSAERVSGTVHIADRRLVGSVSEGYFYGARIRPGRFVIADILAPDPVFEWDPRIDGSTEDAMRFLRQSPLRKTFRSLLDNVDGSGKASLALDLQLAIASGVPRLEGILDLSGNSISVPSLEKGFSDVSGRIRFDQGGMGGEGVKGTYLGRSVEATIETVADRGGHTRVRLSGNADARYIAQHLNNAGLLNSPDVQSMPILTRLQGSAPWQASIDVLEKANGGESPVVLRVESNLLGAAVALPAPFGKPADTSMPLAVEARFANAGDRQMHLNLGALASGIFDLRLQDGDYRLRRGAVHLGDGPATLPAEEAISVTGRMQRAALSEWTGLVITPGDDTSAAGGLPTSVDLRIDELAMLGGEALGVHLQANGDAAGSWRASISGPELDGVLEVPAGRGQQPVVVKFKRLVFTPTDDDEGDPIDPRRLPPLRFSCVHCTYGDMQLHDLALKTSRLSDGLSIDLLQVTTDGFEANADGAWTLDDAGAETTRLDVRLSSDDLGKLLASLGHAGDGGAGAVRGGVTDITLAASWDGPPSQFEWQGVDGVLHFRAGEGTLTDVSRGTTGRLFSLLVVPDLPRRLRGDFSDLFEDGFVYKQIEGTFNIERGNAYTNNLTLDGSMARIDVAGRTGLADEDYDQVITVTPKLRESLPLMPIWLVEKAIRQDLFNKLFSFQYSITGSWEQPSVMPIVTHKEFPSDRS
jgi:uncharacterized protein (TIGR02099 family)